jgi:hypothetical protein
MSISRGLFFLAVGSASIILGLTFARTSGLVFAGLAGLIGLFWAIPEIFPASKRLDLLRSAWISSLWLGLFFLEAVLELISGQPLWLALVIGACALLAWDLQAFLRRMCGLSRPAISPTLEPYHLSMLALVVILGLLLTYLISSLAGQLRLSFSMGLAFVVGLTLAAALVGLAWLMGRGEPG